jgi:hypothetical protein
MNDVWYMLQDHERYVYHYTRSQTLTKHILATGRLRFSRFQYVNDPRESKDWLFNYYSTHGSLPSETRSIDGALNIRLKHSWRIGCFTFDPYEAVATKTREDQGHDILAAAYERGHSLPRMWAQYGENFVGGCLVFSRAQLDLDVRHAAEESGAAVYAGRVEYRNDRVVPDLRRPDPLTISVDEVNRLGFEAAVDAHISMHWKALFFGKARDWAQEREFRWLVSGNGDEDFFVDIRKSLVGIALGDRFPNTLKASVGTYAESNPVTVAVMNWQNGVPQPHPTHWRLLLQASR